MKIWKKAVGFGFLVWLVPFIVAFLIYPARQTARPLFESVMAVTVCTTAVSFGLLYMKNIHQNFVREGLRLGILWFIISVLVDAPLMLFGGPMKMTFGNYMADIGVTYLCYPVITWGLSVAADRSRNN